MPSISDFVLSEQPILTAGASEYEFSSALAKKLTFTNRFDEEVELFRRDGGRILVPRMLTPIGKDDLRSMGNQVKFPKEPTPRDYQEDMFAAVDASVASMENGVFKAPTGWGKTLIGYRAAWKAGVRTLVVTTKDDIFQQWLEGAEKFLGLPKEQIGVIRQDKCQVLDRSFVVGMIQSLSIEDKYPAHIYGAFGLVLFDEVHRLSADSFSKTAFMFRAKRRYGLSATLERADEKEVLFHAHLGPVLAEAHLEMMVPKVMRVPSKWECPRTVKTNNKTGEKEVIRVPHEAGKTAHIDKILAVDKDRNALIAELTKAALSKGRKPVIFSSLHLHLDEIEKALVKVGVPKIKIGRYVGAGTKAEKELRDKMKERPLLLTTFNMMGEGTSIDRLDTAILAMPRGDVIQPVGRIRRLLEGKRFPLVIDIVDEDSPVYKAYSKKRLKWYRSLSAEVENW